MGRRKRCDSGRAPHEMQKCAVTQNCHLSESKQNARLSPRAGEKSPPALGAVHGYSHVLDSAPGGGSEHSQHSIIRQAYWYDSFAYEKQRELPF